MAGYNPVTKRVNLFNISTSNCQGSSQAFGATPWSSFQVFLKHLHPNSSIITAHLGSGVHSTKMIEIVEPTSWRLFNPEPSFYVRSDPPKNYTYIYITIIENYEHFRIFPFFIFLPILKKMLEPIWSRLGKHKPSRFWPHLHQTDQQRRIVEGRRLHAAALTVRRCRHSGCPVAEQKVEGPASGRFFRRTWPWWWAFHLVKIPKWIILSLPRLIWMGYDRFIGQSMHSPTILVDSLHHITSQIASWWKSRAQVVSQEVVVSNWRFTSPRLGCYMIAMKCYMDLPGNRAVLNSMV